TRGWPTMLKRVSDSDDMAFMRLRGPILAPSVALLALVLAPPVNGVKSNLCTSGRYLVLDSSLIPEDTAWPTESVVVSPEHISIGAACQDARVRLRRSRVGTIVHGRWKGCTNLQGSIRLRTTIEPTCSVMTGTLIAHKSNFRKSFTARLSVCGDGVV